MPVSEKGVRKYIPKEAPGLPAPTITDDTAMFIMKMHAEGAPTHKIKVYVQDHCHITLRHEDVWRVIEKPGAKGIINGFKEEYYKRLMEVPICNKRIRVDNLESVRVKVMTAIDENALLDAEQKHEFREDVRTLVGALAAARTEIEGAGMTIKMVGEFNGKSDDELAARRDEILKQAEKLITVEAANGTTVGVDKDTEGIEAT